MKLYTATLITSMFRHSCESRNLGKNWIPGQARNDKLLKTYVAMYDSPESGK